MTFKEETYEAIKESGHNREDVMFIGSSDGKYRIGMDRFDDISDFEYDSGFGAQEIASDLIIYFKDKTYIIRGEYDGSEWWEYNVPKVFIESDEHETFSNLGGHGIMWDTVEKLNKKKNDDQ